MVSDRENICYENFVFQYYGTIKFYIGMIVLILFYDFIIQTSPNIRWISGTGHPHLDFFLVLGKHIFSKEHVVKKHQQHSVLIIPKQTLGVEIIRPLTVFGYDDAAEGHFEVGRKPQFM
jgi:hypothetical protein